MKTYQLVLRGGLTQTVEAMSYRKSQRKLVFTGEQGSTVSLDLDEVIMIEEINDLPLRSPLALSDRWGHRQRSPQFA